MTAIEAHALTHAYRRFPGRRLVSLAGVDLRVESGQCWGLVGPNGSGKSTLLRILAGLTIPAGGEAKVLGRPVGSASLRGSVGYAPETLRWPPALTVAGVLHELAALTAVTGAEARVLDVARVTGLEGLLDRRLGSLSLGQARRVSLAQALMDRPPLLLLDEPFSGLDSLVVHDVRDHLREQVALGAAVVMASHRLEDLIGLATHVAVLRAGLLVREGPAEELLADVDRREGLLSLLGASA